MPDIAIIGINLAKRVFLLHGAPADGSVAFRRKLSRSQLVPFLGDQPCCIVAMEACSTAHGWGREIEALGHRVRPIQPVYVRVGTHKHDTLRRI